MSYYMKESTYGHDFIDPVIKSGRNPYPFMPGRIPANAYGPQRPDTDYSPRGQMSPRRDEYSDPYLNRGPPEPQINTYVSPRESEQQRYGNVSPGGRPMNNPGYDRSPRSPRLNMYERHTHPNPRPDMYDRPSHPSPRPDMVDHRGMPQWQKDSRYNQQRDSRYNQNNARHYLDYATAGWYRPTQKDYGQYAEMQMQEKSLRDMYQNEPMFGFQEYHSPRNYREEDYYQRPPDSYRKPVDDSPRNPEARRMYYEQNRVMQQRQKPWNAQTDDEKYLHGQAKKDYDRIELHDGNFKPWARKYEHPKSQPRYDKYYRAEERKMQRELSYESFKNFEKRMSKQVQHGSGVYMFMRTQMGEALNDCKMSIVKREHILKQAPGHLKGIAKKESIFLLESDDEGDWRLESHSTNKTDNCVFVLWFPTYEVAKNWILYDKDFSKSNFPQQFGSEVFIVPIMKNPLDDRACPTFLMTEFPGVRDFKAFTERVEERFERAANRYEGHANVVFSDRNFHVRGKWVSPNNPIVIHRFKKPIDAFDFYKDNEVRHLRDSLMQSGLVRGRPRSVIFSLDEFM